uniref:Uncharacterized protein n=1 Tax=Rhizophora mucronata TaxID=61149 RepID=A0A2P2QG83_RHIMU
MEAVAKASARDYSIPGTLAIRIFKTLGSVAIMFMSPNTGMLPEIQVG